MYLLVIIRLAGQLPETTNAAQGRRVSSCRELVSQLGGRTENHRDRESIILRKGQTLSDPTEARNETRLPLPPLLFSIMLEATVRPEKKTDGIRTGKGDVVCFCLQMMYST